MTQHLVATKWALEILHMVSTYNGNLKKFLAPIGRHARRYPPCRVDFHIYFHFRIPPFCHKVLLSNITCLQWQSRWPPSGRFTSNSTLGCHRWHFAIKHMATTYNENHYKNSFHFPSLTPFPKFYVGLRFRKPNHYHIIHPCCVFFRNELNDLMSINRRA
jgi:hypothetical protein